MTAIARALAPVTTLRTLQIGMGWFGEEPGGLNRVYASLIEEHLRAGVDVHGLVVGSDGVARASGGTVTSFASRDVRLVPRMRALSDAAQAWLRSRPDAVVASHFAQNALPLLGRLGEHPLVVHCHGPWGQESRVEGEAPWTVLAKELVERRVYRRATHCIVLSGAFRDMLVERFGVPRERIHVVPGGVDVERFAIAQSRAACRTLLGWPTDRPIVLCVRRLVRRVGIDALVDASVELRAQVPDALVLIAGDGPMRAELEARIAARGLGDTVRLIGFVPDEQLPLAYRAADLSVVPTTSLEGFGLITVESLAAGTPCVVTPVGGLTDVVAPISPQLVTASVRAADIGDTLASALRGTIPRPSAAVCARYARERFAWPVVAARVRDVYELARR